jgi:mono/diheme cytochrome c family protein
MMRFTRARRTSLAVALAATATAVIGARATPTSAVPANPTYAAHVAKILFANCAPCHRPGQPAPFSLLSYEDARDHAKAIVDATRRRFMPPWRPSPDPSFAPFQNPRRLSDDDIATLARWADEGTPAGDLRRAPRPPTFSSGWPLGLPDVSMQLPRSIAVPAQGEDIYRNLLITMDKPDDLWMTGLDYAPTSRDVVHHALFFVVPSSWAIRDVDVLPGLNPITLRWFAGPGASSSGTTDAAVDIVNIGGWIPGMTPRKFPEGVALKIPKYSNLVMQICLRPAGRLEQEDGRVGLYLAKTPPLRSLVGIDVPPMFGFAAGLDIPAGNSQFVLRDTFALPHDVVAVGVRGFAHDYARRMTMTAKPPAGPSRGLLSITDWRYGWQDTYFFAKSMPLAKGTTIDASIVYDNSTENPRNPNIPAIPVLWGRDALDEMGSMTLLVTVPTAGGSADGLRQAVLKHFQEQLNRPKR